MDYILEHKKDDKGYLAVPLLAELLPQEVYDILLRPIQGDFSVFSYLVGGLFYDTNTEMFLGENLAILISCLLRMEQKQRRDLLLRLVFPVLLEPQELGFFIEAISSLPEQEACDYLSCKADTCALEGKGL